MIRLLLLAGVVTTASLAAQQPTPAPGPPPTFEVASVKRNTSGEGFIQIGMQPGGRLTMTNVPVRQMIVRAYQVQPFQVLGGPSWITSDRFNVSAKAEDGAPPAQLNVMLQTLLADRFKLRVRRETRESDVFRLVKARADGKLGPQLQPARVDCSAGRGRGAAPPPGGSAPTAPGTAAPAPPPVGGPAAGRGGPLAGDCSLMMAPGRLQAAGQPIAAFANTLSNQLGRPVFDETGLAGGYDFTVTFLPESGGRGMPPGAPPPGAPELPPIDPNAPSLPTALQEQLGLKLEAAKGPVEMIVIENIEQPTED